MWRLVAACGLVMAAALVIVRARAGWVIGLLYADGIHDTLYGTAGKYHDVSVPTVPKARTAGGEVEILTASGT